jgi:hypothetical protein
MAHMTPAESQTITRLSKHFQFITAVNNVNYSTTAQGPANWIRDYNTRTVTVH